MWWILWWIFLVLISLLWFQNSSQYLSVVGSKIFPWDFRGLGLYDLSQEKENLANRPPSWQLLFAWSPISFSWNLAWVYTSQSILSLMLFIFYWSSGLYDCPWLSDCHGLNPRPSPKLMKPWVFANRPFNWQSLDVWSSVTFALVYTIRSMLSCMLLYFWWSSQIWVFLAHLGEIDFPFSYILEFKQIYLPDEIDRFRTSKQRVGRNNFLA